MSCSGESTENKEMNKNINTYSNEIERTEERSVYM